MQSPLQYTQAHFLAIALKHYHGDDALNDILPDFDCDLDNSTFPSWDDSQPIIIRMLD